MPSGDWNFDELAPDHRIVIEIGSGMGEAALAYAQTNPADFLVCLEVHTPGVGSMIFKADEAGIKNIKVVVRDALEVIAESIADNSVDEFRIWFPIHGVNKNIITDKSFILRLLTFF